MERASRHWPMFQRVYSHAGLMDRMMERVGAEPSKAVRMQQGLAWQEARTQCLGCPDGRRCRDWLEATEPTTQPPDFCRGAALLRRCRTMADVTTREIASHQA